MGADLRWLLLRCNIAGGLGRELKGERGIAPGSSDHDIELLYCRGLTLTRVTGGILQFARSTGKAIAINYCQDLVLNQCRVFNSDLPIIASFRIEVNDLDVCDRYIGYTNVTTPYYGVNISAGSDDVIVDGMTFGYSGVVPNVHPVSGMAYVAASSRVRVRSIGSYASRLKNWRPHSVAVRGAQTTTGSHTSSHLAARMTT